MAEYDALSFARLLRQLRTEARLTQEELAEAASVSPRSVSDWERGINRTARKDTALLLADALTLAEPVRELFVAAARGKIAAADVMAARQHVAQGAFAAAATRSLPRDIATFTGREAELRQLMVALYDLAEAGGVVGIHAIDGMAGIGKTALAIHAAHRLASSFPDGQFFLPLHAHTAGQRPVDPADALANVLLAAGVPAAQIPPGVEARAARWRDQVAGKKVMLVLDDAAGHDQVRPLLPAAAGSLVLVTSRRRLTALEDATVISLGTLHRAEAAHLLARLAGRPDLASGTGPAEEITRLCGYLPLAIGMIASKLRHHPTWSAAELAADLAAARDRLDLMDAENVSVAAAFDLSYSDLPPGTQRLFRLLGLVPGPSFDSYAAAALDGTGVSAARRRLSDLYDQHLLIEPASGRYELHDLVREYARKLAAASEPGDCDAAVDRLLDYYLHTALTADRHIPTWDTSVRRRPLVSWTGAAPRLSSLADAAAWLGAERPNLLAAARAAAATGRHLHAVHMPAALGGYLHAQGMWDESAALHQTALAAARLADDRPGQAGILHELGLLETLTCNFPAAATSLDEAIAIYADGGDRAGQAYAICQLALVQDFIGDYPAAMASHLQALTLARDSGDQVAEACALQGLSYAQQLTAEWEASAANVAEALDLYRGLGHRLGQAETFNLLGVLQTLTGDYTAAADSERTSLAMACDLGDRPHQAWALNDLGMVQQLTGDYQAATASHEQALDLWRELGFRLGQAEALNRLGEVARLTSATDQARQYFTDALAIARDINAVAEQACALEGIGNSHLDDGNPSLGSAYLLQALEISERVGALAALRIRETLRRHGLTSPSVAQKS